MKEQIISIKTYKLSREKGYSNIGTFFKNVVHNYVDSGGNKIDDTYTKVQMVTEEIQPTQSLLQKWLREVHNIDVYVVPHHTYPRSDKRMYKFGILNNVSVKDTYNFYHDTYEIALEKGLQTALRLLP